MLQQLSFLTSDYKNLLGRRKIRLLHIWMSRFGVGIIVYRLERGMYITFGRAWEIFRVLLSPLTYLLYAYSNCDIHYKANICPGLLVLHPAVGVVISGKTVAGKT